MKANGTIPLVIDEIRNSGRGVRLFYFTSDSSKAIHYKPGQYLTFLLSEDKSEIRRSYSLCSTPGIDTRLCIGVKRIDNGTFSRFLYDEVKPGDRLLTVGPGGVFVLPEDIPAYQQVFFFAAGSGIIPVYSMVKACLRYHNHLSIILIYSNSSPETTIFLDELKQLKEEFPSQLLVEFLFSNSQNLLRARLHADLIRSLVYAHSKGKIIDSLYYICGPEAYMRLCIFTLRAMNIPADQVKKEIFHTNRIVHKIDPPDKATRQLTIRMGAIEHKVLQEFPNTILQSARRAGLTMPYSCDAGRCGNCIAKCTAGKVWMSYNEVITDKELAQGYILTCTGHAIEGDITIVI
ncbi:MAG TPA: ferredoxin--NADP reductase [Flavisolibacter sp.]|nr:ferredoxin--NADP reductase [Flavisolibacter sp.]